MPDLRPEDDRDDHNSMPSNSKGKGRMIDLRIASPAQDERPFCIDCQNYSHDWESCVEREHILPKLQNSTRGMSDDAVIPDQHTPMPGPTTSGTTYLSHPANAYDTSSSSGYMCPDWLDNDFTGSSGRYVSSSIGGSHTRGSLYDTFTHSPLQESSRSNTGPGNPISNANWGFGEVPIADGDCAQFNIFPIEDPLAHDVPMSEPTIPMTISQVVPLLTVDQSTVFESYRKRWASQNRRPTDAEIIALASLEQLSPASVQAWFTVNLEGQVPGQPDSFESDANTNVLQAVKVYINTKNKSSCGMNGHAQKAGPDKRYRCPWCAFSSHKSDSWQRHLLTKYPQDFWHCILCREQGKKASICSRKDKILAHLQVVHSVVDPDAREKIRSQSQVPYTAPYPNECPFQSPRGPCSFSIESWSGFVSHCLEHFRSGNDGETWHLRTPGDDDDGDNDNNDGDDDDDDDYDDDHEDGESDDKSGDQNNANQGTTSENSWYVWNSLPSFNDSIEEPDQRQRRNDHASIGEHGRHKQDASDALNEHSDLQLTPRPTTYPDLKALERKNLRMPTSLIDVLELKIVDTPSRCTYLALNYTRVSSFRSDSEHHPCSAMHKFAGFDLRASQNIPPLFTEALTTTRDMGYRYLWIDLICEQQEDYNKADAIMKHATLIVVALGSPWPSKRLWFYTCHFERLRTVLSWAQYGHPGRSFSHVQNLGHGTYGIVDEVRLRSTRQSFARKMYFKRKGNNARQLTHQHEIDLLRKFDHPNIPRFVAAYIEKRSLNMLMLPVADCDLKDFLADPASWPEKKDFMHHWYGSLASAVAYMHSLSCKHKDIKPANILISGRDVLLSDFGIARDFSAGDSASLDHGLMTPKFCAPETALRRPRGRKSDVFSLGCVFAEMLTVNLDLSLGELGSYLRVKSAETTIMYWQHINNLKTWVAKLQDRVKSPYQRRILTSCLRMLDVEPTCRPSAAELASSFALNTLHLLEFAKQEYTTLQPPVIHEALANGPNLLDLSIRTRIFSPWSWAGRPGQFINVSEICLTSNFCVPFWLSLLALTTDIGPQATDASHRAQFVAQNHERYREELTRFTSLSKKTPGSQPRNSYIITQQRDSVGCEGSLRLQRAARSIIQLCRCVAALRSVKAKVNETDSTLTLDATLVMVIASMEQHNISSNTSVSLGFSSSDLVQHRIMRPHTPWSRAGQRPASCEDVVCGDRVTNMDYRSKELGRDHAAGHLVHNAWSEMLLCPFKRNTLKKACGLATHGPIPMDDVSLPPNFAIMTLENTKQPLSSKSNKNMAEYRTLLRDHLAGHKYASNLAIFGSSTTVMPSTTFADMDQNHDRNIHMSLI